MTTPRCLCECSLLHRCEIWTGRASTSLCCRRRRRSVPTRSSTMATRSWRQAELYRCVFLELSFELSLEIRLRIMPRTASLKLGFVAEICLSMHNVSVAETAWGSCVLFFANNKLNLHPKQVCRVFFHYFVKFLPRFHKRWWKQFENF